MVLIAQSDFSASVYANPLVSRILCEPTRVVKCHPLRSISNPEQAKWDGFERNATGHPILLPPPEYAGSFYTS